MSEESSTESVPESTAEPNNSGSGGARKLVLLGILVIVLGLFAYDQFVTKGEFESTVKELGELQNLVDSDQGLKKKGDTDGDGYITPTDVSLAAGRDPATTADLGENYVVETYSWGRVIPGMTYDAFAVYRKGKERNVLFQVATDEPDAESLPKAPVVGEPGSVSNPVLGNAPPANADAGDDKKNSEDNDSGDEGDDQ